MNAYQLLKNLILSRKPKASIIAKAINTIDSGGRDIPRGFVLDLTDEFTVSQLNSRYLRTDTGMTIQLECLQ